MAQFEQLQELWQRQPQPAVAPVEAANMGRLLRAYARRQNWMNGGKTVLVTLVIAWALVRVRSYPTAVAGVLLAAAAAAFLVAQEWRRQRAIARRDFTAPSVGFVRGTIESLFAQRDICRRQYWPFLASMIVAENLVLASSHRVWLRVVASALPFAAFELGLWVRRKRFDHECGPLIEQLRAMQAALEDRPE